MKRYYILILLLYLGCSQYSYIPENIIPKYENITVIDFNKYSEKGFLITTETYNGVYSSVGILQSTIRSGAKRIKIKKETKINDQGFIYVYEWQIDTLYVNDILDTIYSEAVRLGGNAIINFSISSADDVHGPITVPGIRINGFIIKRLDLPQDPNNDNSKKSSPNNMNSDYGNQMLNKYYENNQ